MGEQEIEKENEHMDKGKEIFNLGQTIYNILPISKKANRITNR